MREALEVIDGERMKFSAKLERYGGKGGGKFTVLLTDIRFTDGRLATDHAWFNLTKGFKSLRLSPGERVSFFARVKPYQKGYIGKKDVDRPVSYDYKLSHPSQVKRIN